MDVVALVDGLQGKHGLRNVETRDVLAQNILPHQQRLWPAETLCSSPHSEGCIQQFHVCLYDS